MNINQNEPITDSRSTTDTCFREIKKHWNRKYTFYTLAVINQLLHAYKLKWYKIFYGSKLYTVYLFIGNPTIHPSSDHCT